MRISRITLKSFLVSLLGILTAEVDFSNGQHTRPLDHRHCYNITGGGEICYFFVSNGESNWNSAHGKCQNRSSSLPIIRNREEQTAIEEYFKHLKQSQERSISAVWTSGKRKIYNDWTWINNNQTLNTTLTICHPSKDEQMQTHMLIHWEHNKNNTLKPEDPLLDAWYLCQYKDRQCNGQQHEVNATNGCLIPSEYGNVSWYGARNECLSNEGDLAVLTHQDLQNLKNHAFPQSQYWIGLRKADWVWITSSYASGEEEEVKYTKWAKIAIPVGESCIYIDASNGQWRANDCSGRTASVVCEKRIPTEIDSTSMKSTTAKMGDNNASVMAAVGAGAAIVILCIIIVILVVKCRKSKSSNNKMEPAQTDSETTKDKKTKKNSSPTTTTEERSIYADIPLAEKTANDTVEATPKGTVYASLDFNERVTYAEPSKLYNNTQNVSGPIYAEPSDANGNGTTSAGCSPTVKIGPMGDVYALPTTNVTPSSAKMAERPIYANT